jgi:hypothetical protein
MALYWNHATGFEIPPFFLKNKEVVARLENNKMYQEFDDLALGVIADDSLKQEFLDVPHFDKLMIKWEDEVSENWWTLPIDPVISVTGKNILVRRNVLKISEDIIRRGSVKELWSQDDYEINIAGVLIGNAKLPELELMQLRKYCESRKIIQVRSKLLRLFGIYNLAIEDYSLPFTKGIENQMYTIKAYSDDNIDLLVKDEK